MGQGWGTQKDGGSLNMGNTGREVGWLTLGKTENANKKKHWGEKLIHDLPC